MPLPMNTAIKNGGKTIAVIAGGFYHIYPKENMSLALEMMKNQLSSFRISSGYKATKMAFSVQKSNY